MVKQTKLDNFTQMLNKKMTQNNGTKPKLNPSKTNLLESFNNQKSMIIAKKSNMEEKTNIFKKSNLFNNKLPEIINRYNGTCSNQEYKVPRKNSSGSETCSTSEECTPKKKNIKKTFQKVNKNKIPFKGEAKDFKIKYKTELCKYYEINGYCKYGDKCAYAHGKENLRSKVTNTTAYRTKKCEHFFDKGYCPYGNRCQFAHQLKSNITNNPYDKGMTYGKILETISKLENVENIKKLVEKPRLPVFQQICDNTQNTKSRLLEDIKGLTYKNLYKRIDN